MATTPNERKPPTMTSGTRTKSPTNLGGTQVEQAEQAEQEREHKSRPDRFVLRR
jgi:hypothetical protein